MSITVSTKALEDGREIKICTLTNAKGMVVEILNLGGIITKILVPDREGKLENVVLGYKDYNSYIQNEGCLGALIGRTAGRIAKGRVHLEDKCYQFAINNNQNSLHGGLEGFHTKLWDVTTVEEKEKDSLTLSYISKDGEENYPGELTVSVTYTLTNDNEFILTYKGNTTKETIVNMTNHSYFNLSGDAKRSIHEQKLFINSDSTLELDEELIPTGVFLPVEENEPFNFKTPKLMGKDIDSDHIQIKYGAGYDHPWVLKDGTEAAYLVDEASGRKMTISTNQKAVVIYSYNFPGEKELSCGCVGKKQYATCFETQGFPIGPDELFKEGAILKPEDTYYHETKFAFSIC